MVQVRSVPRHAQRGRGAGAAAHRGTRVRVSGQPDIELLLDEREHFRLDEFGVLPRHRVVLQAALAALGVAAAVTNGHSHHRRHFLLRDEVVERGEQQLIGTIGADDEWSDRAGRVTGRNVDGHAARVRPRTAVDVQDRGIGGIFLSFARQPNDTRIDLAIGRVHYEVVDRTFRDSFLFGHVRGSRVRWTDDEVAIHVHWRHVAVGQFSGFHVAGR
jgi:hypothetical protein